MESDALHVVFQSALGSAKAFEQGWYRKTALCSSSVEQAHGDWMAGLMRAGTTALSSPTLKLTQVRLTACPRPRNVLLCMLTPCTLGCWAKFCEK